MSKLVSIFIRLRALPAEMWAEAARRSALTPAQRAQEDRDLDEFLQEW